MTIEEHYNAIAPKLTNYLVGVGVDYHAACDIVQETFLRLWKKRDTLLDDPAQVNLEFPRLRQLQRFELRPGAPAPQKEQQTGKDGRPQQARHSMT